MGVKRQNLKGKCSYFQHSAFPNNVSVVSLYYTNIALLQRLKKTDLFFESCRELTVSSRH